MTAVHGLNVGGVPPPISEVHKRRRVEEQAGGITWLRGLMSRASHIYATFADSQENRDQEISFSIIHLWIDSEDLHLGLQDLVDMKACAGKVITALQLCLPVGRLYTIPDDLTGISSLEEFHVGGLKQESLPQSVCTLTHLKRLQVENSTIVSIADRVFPSLTRLEELLLLDCKSLLALPNDITEAEKLKVLDVSGCACLQALPSSMGDLQELRELILGSETEIQKFPASMEEMRELELLDLQGWQGREIPRFFVELPELQIRLSNFIEGLNIDPALFGNLYEKVKRGVDEYFPEHLTELEISLLCSRLLSLDELTRVDIESVFPEAIRNAEGPIKKQLALSIADDWFFVEASKIWFEDRVVHSLAELLYLS